MSILFDFVVFRKPVVAHADERRELVVVYDGHPDFRGFRGSQCKVLRGFTTPSKLGGKANFGHYHSYRELYHVRNGRVTFILMDPSTRETRKYEMNEDDTLLIPSGMAHCAFADIGLVLDGHTSGLYSGGSETPIEMDLPDTLPYGVKLI